MSFLPAVARVRIEDMGYRVDKEVAESRADSDLETTRARQAHYIKWCLIQGILNPVGAEEGWERFLAIYAKYVMLGVNYKNKQNVRSGTVNAELGSSAIVISQIVSLILSLALVNDDVWDAWQPHDKHR